MTFGIFIVSENRDYVYVRDGRYSYSRLLRSLTGRNQYPQPIVTSSSYFYIQFTSDYSRSYSGFLMHYSTYPGKLQMDRKYFYFPGKQVLDLP